jgi:hypothetical protein
MEARLSMRCGSALLLVAVVLFSASTAQAGRCVGVFFRGFNAPVGTSGMDNLEAHLVAAFGGNPVQPFSTAVFNWTDQQQAFDFIGDFTDVDCLVLAGHSFGANSAIELTTNFLEPAGIPVDLLVQFDSVGANDDVLPAGVALGFNYHQVSTGIFEPQGESNVQDSTNVYVEDDYSVSDSDITHTQIDCPLFERTTAAYAALFGSRPDLYARVEGHVAPLFVAAPVPTLGLPGVAALIAGLLISGCRAASRGSVTARRARS